MGIVPTYRAQKSELRKQQINEAALSLFKMYGFSNVTVGDICNKVGISVGSFYNFYGSKENLLYICIYLLRDEYLLQHFSMDESIPFAELLIRYFMVNADYNRSVP